MAYINLSGNIGEWNSSGDRITKWLSFYFRLRKKVDTIWGENPFGGSGGSRLEKQQTHHMFKRSMHFYFGFHSCQHLTKEQVVRKSL